MSGWWSSCVQGALAAVVPRGRTEHSSVIVVPGSARAGRRVQVHTAGWKIPTGVWFCSLGPGLRKVAHGFRVCQNSMALGLCPIGGTLRGLWDGVDVAVATVLVARLQRPSFALRSFHKGVPVLLRSGVRLQVLGA